MLIFNCLYRNRDLLSPSAPVDEASFTAGKTIPYFPHPVQRLCTRLKLVFVPNACPLMSGLYSTPLILSSHTRNSVRDSIRQYECHDRTMLCTRVLQDPSLSAGPIASRAPWWESDKTREDFRTKVGLSCVRSPRVSTANPLLLDSRTAFGAAVSGRASVLSESYEMFSILLPQDRLSFCRWGMVSAIYLVFLLNKWWCCPSSNLHV